MKKQWSNEEARKILNCFARCLGWDEVVLVMFEAEEGSVYDPKEEEEREHNKIVELQSENYHGHRAWTEITKKTNGKQIRSDIYASDFADALDKILDILHSEDTELSLGQMANYIVVDGKSFLDLWKFELALEGIEL